MEETYWIQKNCHFSILKAKLYIFLGKITLVYILRNESSDNMSIFHNCNCANCVNHMNTLGGIMIYTFISTVK